VASSVTPDYWRQLDVFNPEAFNEEVHIIGVGATGSWIAYILAKMGIPKIHAWDFDMVEAHNLPNQIYGRMDVGKAKVEALREHLDADCGTVVVPHNERVDGSQKLSGIVYLCTDTMSSRKEIWEKSIRYQLNVKLMIETRLGAELGIIHTVRPCYPQDVRGFEDTLFSDGEGEESPCTYRAISTVVATVAGLAAHKLVKFTAGEFEISPRVEVVEGDKHSNYEMLCIRPILITATEWAKTA
jgi:molybdopterin/thiamine biosynthesis adenylyltransferase